MSSLNQEKVRVLATDSKRPIPEEQHCDTLVGNPRTGAEFDEYAAAYAALLRDPIRDRFGGNGQFFHRRKLEVILDFLAQRDIAPAKLSWLDVGCGRGELLQFGASKFGRAVGCDPSPAMTATCNSVELFAQPFTTDLPFPDSSFDLVTAACVYHHVPLEERKALTQAVHRVLKPDGIFGMLEHNPLNPITRLIVSRCPIDRNAALLTARDAARIIRNSNLKVLQTRYFLYLPENVFQRIGRLENWLHYLPLGGQFATFGRNC